MPSYKENKINTLHEFTVEGSHDFPFDMLRYDKCWPKAEVETSKLGYWQPSNSQRQITLIGLNEPTIGRWESFGWTIVETSRRSY